MTEERMRQRVKAKPITSQITGKMLSDIFRVPVEIEKLRLGMQAISRPIVPKSLGAIVEENISARFNVKGLHWYKHVSGMHDKRPYIFEILIIETENQAHYVGVNHSVTFGDFLRKAGIKVVEKGKSRIWSKDIKGALDKSCKVSIPLLFI
ncbi:hypothetical protein METHB2_690002 [Candidatus Methylobacter favarea]|uniref:Uncharacterized protein n=1 Tax=Candidatus Methylobacter favarea TaxID=2707345 RepID=A0A8S0XKY2_9GAMM|nr:hypothetical protein [Candidatus Methylobacter favarea]CAA9892382.1 hypothetical protein METHB2_690002 [Candidatus Methylobacter favarea]